MSTDFQVAQGNGRLYKCDPQRIQQEQVRRQGLRDKGHAWATDDKIPEYEGYIQVGQEFIGWLQKHLNEAGEDVVRMNIKSKIEKMQSGSPCMHIKEAWFKDGVSLKEFIDTGAQMPPANIEVKSTTPQSSEAKNAAIDIDFDDDIPF